MNPLRCQLSRASRLKHENFVELLSYCVEEDLRLVTYEYATLGSLHDYLHGMVLAFPLISSSLSLVASIFLYVMLFHAQVLQYSSPYLELQVEKVSVVQNLVLCLVGNSG